jgi:TonB family protein
MHFLRIVLAALFLFCLSQHRAIAQDTPDSALGRAQKLSSLTVRDAKPFRIKVTISEPANPSSLYHAVIEESWLSKTRWTRTLIAPGLTQIVYVDGDKRIEQNTGDYYPIWLRSFVTAATDPLENEVFWQQISARMTTFTSTNGKPSSSCARAQFKIGTTTLNNDAFAVICFNADGTLESVVSPDYSMEFQDPRPFGNKRIATRLVDSPEPGTKLVGVVDVLEELSAGATMTAPDGASSPIHSIRINQDTFYKLADSQSEVTWPPVRSGNTYGKLSMYISTDRNGRVREAYPLSSDNAGLQDSIREQLLKWQLKPAASNGERVQTEAALTFAFTTKMESSTPDQSSSQPSTSPSPTVAPQGPIRISSSVLGGLMVRSFPPVYPPDAKARHIMGAVVFSAIISKTGNVSSLQLIKSPSPSLTDAAMVAVKQWGYRPYLLNGTPVEVESTITVNFDMR